MDKTNEVCWLVNHEKKQRSLFFKSSAKVKEAITRTPSFCISLLAQILHENSNIIDSWTNHLNHKKGNLEKRDLEGMKNCPAKVISYRSNEKHKAWDVFSYNL